MAFATSDSAIGNQVAVVVAGGGAVGGARDRERVGATPAPSRASPDPISVFADLAELPRPASDGSPERFRSRSTASPSRTSMFVTNVAAILATGAVVMALYGAHRLHADGQVQPALQAINGVGARVATTLFAAATTRTDRGGSPKGPRQRERAPLTRTSVCTGPTLTNRLNLDAELPATAPTMAAGKAIMRSIGRWLDAADDNAVDRDGVDAWPRYDEPLGCACENNPKLLPEPERPNESPIIPRPCHRALRLDGARDGDTVGLPFSGRCWPTARSLSRSPRRVGHAVRR
jgi:hypothetical protein